MRNAVLAEQVVIRLKNPELMDRKKSFLFLADPSYKGSSEMRGRVVVTYLRKRGFNADFQELPQTRKLNFRQIHQFSRYDVVLFIKFLRPRLARLLAFLGCKVFYDPIDNYSIFDEDAVFQCGAKRVTWIAMSEAHRVCIEKTLSIAPANTTVIPHHHSNYSDRACKNDVAKNRVGYVGRLNTFDLPADVIDFLKDAGIQVCATEAAHLESTEICDEICKLDVFIIYFTSNEYLKSQELAEQTMERVINLKPSQKLTLPFSLGVPTVFLPYASYLEAIKNSGFTAEDFLVARNDRDLLRQLQWLLIDSTQAERDELVDRQKIVAKRFSIDTVVESYTRLVL